MSSAASAVPHSGPLQHRKAMLAAERAAYRENCAKLICALLIAVCFWFSVPYKLPIQLDPNPLRAAADEAVSYEGNLSRQLAMPIIGVVAGFALYRFPKRGRFARSNRLLPFAVGYVGWALASAVWSTDPAITRKRLLVFCIDILFAFALARVASVRELALLGFVATGIVALLALYADVVLLKTFNPLDPDYRFMGVMTANFQAMNLFVSVLCGLTLLQQRLRWARWLVPALLLLGVLLLLTRARIGAILFVGVLLLVCIRMGRRHLGPQAQALALLLAFTVLLPAIAFSVGRSGQGAITSAFMMGRKDTENTASLSNRAPLWQELLHSAAERPVLGFGYEAFWSAERVQTISIDQGWVVPHAHNTYLDQVLSLGLVGCLLYAGMVWGACITAWRRHRRGDTEMTLLPALLLSWVALLSLTESLPISPYLPTLLAYSCIVKLCMVEDSDRDPVTAEREVGVTRAFVMPEHNRPISRCEAR